MRASAITLHNFRTFLHATIALSPYSLLVGPNNSGKSNVIDAIRVFYEKDLKFDHPRDFPKMPTLDSECWIEIEFQPSIAEFEALKEEYRLPTGTFKVRKYLYSATDDADGKPRAGIYAYTGGELSDSRFYGAKNVQQGKLGEVVYIPAVSKLDDHTKLSGPSAFRDLLTGVLRPLLQSSPSYNNLRDAFFNFEKGVKTEKTPDGRSIDMLEEEITTELTDWGARFEITINPLQPDDLVKDLIGHNVSEKALAQPMDPRCIGQGFQRHLIFTLIRLAARHAASASEPSAKEFSPRLVWILFEEPEAFMHPSQIESLDASLRTLAGDIGSQVLISTHNPQFVSLNIDDLPSLIHLFRDGPTSSVGQVTTPELRSIFQVNLEEVARWRESGVKVNEEDLRSDMEAAKFALWLNPLRCSAFFALKVLLVEGPTDQVVIRHLLSQSALAGQAQGVYVMDAMGKFNMHRFMNLFGALAVPHAVLYDQDDERLSLVDATIRGAANKFTIRIDNLPNDIETELGVPPAGDPHRKPQHMLYFLRQAKVTPERLEGLASRVRSLLGI